MQTGKTGTGKLNNLAICYITASKNANLTVSPTRDLSFTFDVLAVFLGKDVYVQ